MFEGLLKNTGNEKPISSLQKYVYMGVSGLAIIMFFLKWVSVSAMGYSVTVLSLFNIQGGFGSLIDLVGEYAEIPAWLTLVDVLCKLVALICVAAWGFNIYRLYQGSDKFGLVAGGISGIVSILLILLIMITSSTIKSEAGIFGEAISLSPSFSLILLLLISVAMIVVVFKQIRFGSDVNIKDGINFENIMKQGGYGSDPQAPSNPTNAENMQQEQTEKPTKTIGDEAVDLNNRVCEKCGATNTSISNFCQNCGNDLSIVSNKCSACGAELEPEAKFCGSCGKPRD